MNNLFKIVWGNYLLRKFLSSGSIYSNGERSSWNHFKNVVPPATLLLKYKLKGKKMQKRGQLSPNSHMVTIFPFPTDFNMDSVVFCWHFDYRRRKTNWTIHYQWARPCGNNPQAMAKTWQFYKVCNRLRQPFLPNWAGWPPMTLGTSGMWFLSSVADALPFILVDVWGLL